MFILPENGCMTVLEIYKKIVEICRKKYILITYK